MGRTWEIITNRIGGQTIWAGLASIGPPKQSHHCNYRLLSFMIMPALAMGVVSRSSSRSNVILLFYYISTPVCTKTILPSIASLDLLSVFVVVLLERNVVIFVC